MSRLWKLAGVATAILAGAQPVRAQTAAERVIGGDSAYRQRHTTQALEDFLQAIAADPSDYEAYWKASRVEADIAEAAPKGGPMDSLLAAARRHAETAVHLKPGDVQGHFALARALGRQALAAGTMERIRYSKLVRAEALAALACDSTHAGALHVLGMWNAEIMRVNGLARVFAKAFLGAKVFALANWEDAQRLLEEAVRLDPTRIVHRLDLGAVYADRGETDKARAMFTWIASAPIIEPNDDIYKQKAAARLRKL